MVKTKMTIGASEIYGIIYAYATDSELESVGISPEKMHEETPYKTAWALYHERKRTPGFFTPSFAPELSQYGNAVERWAENKLSMYFDESTPQERISNYDLQLHATCDFTAYTSEKTDVLFAKSGLMAPITAKKIVIENKTENAFLKRDTIPFKYLFQTHQQALLCNADFIGFHFIKLKEDSAFIRGQLTALSGLRGKRNRANFFQIMDNSAETEIIIIEPMQQLQMLIKLCMSRFINDYYNAIEPPFDYAKTAQVAEIIRANGHCENSIGNLTINFNTWQAAKNKVSSATAELDELKKQIVSELYAQKLLSGESVNASVKMSANNAILIKEK
jgi:hypothetical protein